MKIYNFNGNILQDSKIQFNFKKLESKHSDQGILHAFVKQTLRATKLVNYGHYKNCGSVDRTTAKARQQKGTGRARIGSLKAINIRGGGTAFGYGGNQNPKSKIKRVTKLNKKIRIRANKIAFSTQINDKNSIIVDSFVNNNVAVVNKTASAYLILKELNFENNNNKTLVVFSSGYKFCRAFKNIKNVDLVHIDSLTIINLLKFKSFIFEKDAIFKHCKRLELC